MKIEPQALVRFVNGGGNHPVAVDFCIMRGLTGAVVAIADDRIVVDAGLGYKVWTTPDCLSVVAIPQEIPIVHEE